MRKTPLCGIYALIPAVGGRLHGAGFIAGEVRIAQIAGHVRASGEGIALSGHGARERSKRIAGTKRVDDAVLPQVEEDVAGPGTGNGGV